MVAIVDDADADALLKWKWCVQRAADRFYASRREGQKILLMHREILGLSGCRFPLVDHRDGNSLDNRRANLRVATQSQNLANRGAQKNNTSGFKGVSYSQSRDKWEAKIKLMGKTIHLGRFISAELASRAYEAAATKLFGEFAKA